MKDKNIFYDKLGADADKYREIDKFLRLTERFGGKSAAKSRTISLVIALAGAAVCVGIALLFGQTKAYVGAAVFVVIGIVFGFVLNGGKSSEMERAKSIINSDGVQAVYDDLMHCTRIERSDVFIGSRYLFRQGKFMFRMSDVKKCYISTETSGDDTEYYCEADISDEIGSETFELRKLSAIKVQRQNQFEAINKPIESAKIRLE